MKEFTLKEIASATGGRIIRGDENARIKGFSIDSREALQGKMFFAIIGPNNDGHDYLGQAGQKAAQPQPYPMSRKCRQTATWL